MALRALVCFSAVASAFENPAALSRRALLTRAAAIAPLAATVAPAFAGENFYNAQQNKMITEEGAAAQATALYSPSAIAASAPPRAIAGVRIGGTYSDPAHSGLSRKVTLVGTDKVIITGADEDGKAWKVKGTYSGKTVTVDFTPKGGPKDVLATYSIGTGLTFPDGNVWKKIG